MKKLLFVFFIPTLLFGQFTRKSTAEWSLKTHSANLTTAQIDSNSVGEWIGASSKRPTDNTLADTLWSLAASAIDTSRCFKTFGYMSTLVLGSDDSLKVVLWMAPKDDLRNRDSEYNLPPLLSEFVAVDSFTTSSAKEYHIWTDGSPALPNFSWAHIRVENTGSGTETARLKMSFYDNQKRK